ncbi:toxin-antitoxin system YwqK family antitoxin [Flavobacterium agrisoli]|uniref:Membrane-binding protein n=1 Tax=Flavobacterium agrisoli TaxID=2793066 RepID=A0A934PJL9_9FLAO|nr:membrane-binding protein [Flavobacterium agrisoli]MBK0369357.1 membrane-binding protein [Flavobacterium agrisoli]
MRKCVILVAVLFSGIVFAQETKPKLEAVGNTVKATYFYENGKIQQEGFFKDGKLDGAWTAYDENGNKKAFGQYAMGEKTGKWFFWNDSNLSEVDYSDSRIANVKNWKQETVVNRN